MMFTNKLAKLLEKQRKRQTAALLAVCKPEERKHIENQGQLPVSLRHVTLNASEGSHCDIESSGILRSAQNDNPQSQQQSIQNTERKI
jgi:hypothetical protein